MRPQDEDQPMNPDDVQVSCLRWRGTSLPHFRSKTEGEHVVPTVSIDYFFMGPSGQEEAQGVPNVGSEIS